MSESKPGERWTFVVEARDAPDRLMRILNPFSVIGAWPAAASLERAAAGVTIRIEAEGLDGGRAEILRHRLQAQPGVSAVGMVWRASGLAREGA